MIHQLKPQFGSSHINSGRRSPVVSIFSVIRARSSLVSDSLHVFDLEFLLGAMEQHPKIVAVYSKLPADFVAVALIEKNGFQQGSVSRLKAEQDFPDFLPDLPGSHYLQRIGALVG
jgi:hypothetical protein